jgi:hypothetical protein
MRIYGVLVLLLLEVSALQAEWRREQIQPRITVAVCDKVGLAPETLRIAADQARQVFGNAGVDLMWIDSEGNRAPMTFRPSSFEGCGLPSVDVDFLAVISNESPKGWPSGGLGFSIPTRSSPQRVYVLYDQVKIVLKRVPDVDNSTLLGHVVAHELGHLLLAETGHTPSGIMSTSWRFYHMIEAAQGLLRFHPDQAKRIHTDAQTRSVQSASRPVEPSVLRSAHNSRETDK